MNIEELREFCLSVKGASDSFPFGKFGKAAEDVLVFKIMNKMFLYVDIFPSDGIFCVWMKNKSEQISRLQAEYEGIIPIRNNQQINWMGVLLNSDVPDSKIKELIQQSVQEILNGLSKKKQEEYRNLIPQK